MRPLPTAESVADPASVVRCAIGAVNAEDWKAAAALADPVSLGLFVRKLLGRLAGLPPNTITAEEYMRSDPRLPRDVAEHYARESRRYMDPAWLLQQDIPGIASLEMLQTLAPAEILGLWLEGKSARRQIERLAAEGRISQRAAKVRLTGNFAEFPYVVVGAIPDGPRLSHVVYRRDVDAARLLSSEFSSGLTSGSDDEQLLSRELWTRGHPRIATVRQQPDNTWRLVVEDDYLNVGTVQVSAVRVDEPGKIPS